MEKINRETGSKPTRSNLIKSGIFFFLMLYGNFLCAEENPKMGENTIIIDSRHYSHVLGELRNYRIFLPQDYYKHPDKRYSVVYYYHGWSQRYFGSLRKNKEDNVPTDDEQLAEMVAEYDVIVVKTDGYNADPEDPYTLRPYNIGPV